MNRKNRKNQYAAAIFLALMLRAAPAKACSICALAMADRVLPPVGLWCLIAALWYGGTVLIAAGHKTRLPGVPKVVPGVLWIVACLVVGAGITGPIVFLPLFLIAVRAFVLSVVAGGTDELARLQRGLRRLGSVASAAVLVAGGASLFLRQQRTTADFIVRWPGTGPAHVALEELARANTPEDRKQLRFVVDHASGAIAEKAEKALARR